MDTLYQQFGQRVSLARSRKGINQTELALLCSMSRGTIATIEAGKQSVSLDQAYSLCLALDTPLVDMLPALSIASVDRAMHQVETQVDGMNEQDLAAIKSLLVNI
jgi:transcriptional regulator with XRE-family HTH domain